MCVSCRRETECRSLTILTIYLGNDIGLVCVWSSILCARFLIIQNIHRDTQRKRKRERKNKLYCNRAVWQTIYECECIWWMFVVSRNLGVCVIGGKVVPHLHAIYIKTYSQWVMRFLTSSKCFVCLVQSFVNHIDILSLLCLAVGDMTSDCKYEQKKEKNLLINKSTIAESDHVFKTKVIKAAGLMFINGYSVGQSGSARP